MEMKSAIDSNVRTTKRNQKYIVHYLRCSTMLENVPLQKATRLCSDLPILVIAYTGNAVKARCCVPKVRHEKKYVLLLGLVYLIRTVQALNSKVSMISIN